MCGLVWLVMVGCVRVSVMLGASGMRRRLSRFP
jgi:hypothetical protein